MQPMAKLNYNTWEYGRVLPFPSREANLERAQALAAQGIPVFPCKADKSPLTPNGFKDATTDLEIIRELWANWSDALIGIPTGAASGFAAIDIDRRGDKDGFSSLAEREIELPRTCAYQTLNNGEHHLYQRPDVDKFPSRNGVLPGVDIKADG